MDAAVADLVEVSENRVCDRSRAAQSRCLLLTSTRQAEIADPTHENTMHPSKSTVPRQSRKVVDPPGGKSSVRLTGEEYEETDALSLAPPRDGGNGVDVEMERMERMRLHVEPEAKGGATIEDDKDEYVSSEGRS